MLFEAQSPARDESCWREKKANRETLYIHISEWQSWILTAKGQGPRALIVQRLCRALGNRYCPSKYWFQMGTRARVVWHVWIRHASSPAAAANALGNLSLYYTLYTIGSLLYNRFASQAEISIEGHTPKAHYWFRAEMDKASQQQLASSRFFSSIFFRIIRQPVPRFFCPSRKTQ